MQLRLLTVCMTVLLGSLLTPTTTARAAPSQEYLAKAFATQWQAFTPLPELDEKVKNEIRIFANSATRPGCWGLMLPLDFGALIKVQIVDSKGKPIGDPVYIVNHPADQRPDAIMASAVIPGHFNPRASLRLAVTLPDKGSRCTKARVIPLKQARIAAAPDDSLE